MFFNTFFVFPLSFTLAKDVLNAQSLQSSDNAKVTKVVSMDFCYSCLEEKTKGFKTSHEALPVFAALENDHKATFGPEFTICVSTSNPNGFHQTIFTLLGKDGDVAIQAYVFNDALEANLYLLFGKWHPFLLNT